MRGGDLEHIPLVQAREMFGTLAYIQLPGLRRTPEVGCTSSSV
jgi:hypothetical protein